MRIEPKKILCAIDFSDFAPNILSYGKLLAKEYGSTLYLCHIVPESVNVSGHLPSYFDYSGIEAELVDNAHERLVKMATDLDMNCKIIVCAGHPANKIEQIARDQKFDMVITATHGGSGMKRFLIGSVTDRLVKVLKCPLLVLPGHAPALPASIDQPIRMKKILVGCDFSSDSGLAFDYALSLAQEFQTQLHLAHVISLPEHFKVPVQSDTQMVENYSGTWDRLMYPDVDQDYPGESDIKGQTDPPSMFRHLEAQMAKMVPEECQHWCTPITVFLEGQPYKELVDYAKKNQMDMIVLGIRGHSLLEKFLVGSTTDRVISQASCPVLAVRHTPSSE